MLRSQPAATSPLWLGQQVTLSPQEEPPWGYSLWEHREGGAQQRGQDTSSEWRGHLGVAQLAALALAAVLLLDGARGWRGRNFFP